MSDAGPPLVYIVTRSHNALQLTSTCIDALRKLTYPNFRILVVDDGSTDGSGERLRAAYPDVLVVRSEKYVEYCRGLNLGIKEALRRGAEFVFIVNNDTKDFSPNYLEEVMRAFEESPRVGFVGSWVYDYEGEPRCVGKLKEKLGVPVDTPTEGYVIKREVFEKVGYFNEKLVRYFEDLDYIARLRAAGYETKSVGSVHFWHLGGGTSSKQVFIPNYYRMRNLIVFMKRYCADRPLSWKVRTVRVYSKAHADRYRAFADKGERLKSLGVVGSAALGLAAGFFTRWEENP